MRKQTLIEAVRALIAMRDPKAPRILLRKAVREEAERIVLAAEMHAAEMLKLGGDYSGSTERHVRWGEMAGARTETSEGGRYSRSCKYRKISATHTVTLSFEGVVVVHRNPEAVQLSRMAGHRLLDLGEPVKKGVYPCVYVQPNHKQIESVEGWLAIAGPACAIVPRSAHPPEKVLKLARRKCKAMITRRLTEGFLAAA